MKESFCHPDASHYCVECCEPINCCLLGRLSDGSTGCLGHNSMKEESRDQLPQRPLCADFDCLSMYPRFNEHDRKKILALISTLPVGQFKMSSIFSLYRKNK